MTTMLSPNFSLEEFLRSDTAEALGILNVPDESALENLKRLALVMEEVRAICGGHPVTITSGYRCAELNAAIGGAENSAHLYGLGCDFVIPSCGDALTVCMTIELYMAELGIDQLIWEMGDWTHLGLVEENITPRCECLTIDEEGTSVGFM